MRSARWQIFFFFPVLLSCGLYGEDTESSPGNTVSASPVAAMLIHGRWLALGDSDFDSYQADDFERRVNPMAINAACVLSPVEVQARDGRDFGQFAKWEDGRRHDYRGNFSLSGATVRSSLFGWREKFKEDWAEGIIEIVRELRNALLGYKPALGRLMLAELESLNNDPELNTKPVVIQISLGINDIDGVASLYNEFNSTDSHFAWIDTRTDVIKNAVERMLDAYPNSVIVLWELHDDGAWDTRYSAEQEKRITSHTDYWNSNLKQIANARPSVIVFEVNKLTRHWIGRKSDGTDREIIIDGIHYYREFVPSQAADDGIDNTKYILTRDGHANTVLSALFTRELYRLLNDSFGAGIPPLTPVQINTITCQVENPTDEIPILEVPRHATVKLSDLPYLIGKIQAFDVNGKDISDSAVATSDNGGVLFGDGQNIQMRPERHGKGSHHITITVNDAYGRSSSKSMKIIVK